MPAQTPCAADGASSSASMDSDGGVEQDKAIGSSCYNAVTGQEERHVHMLVESICFIYAAFCMINLGKTQKGKNGNTRLA